MSNISFQGTSIVFSASVTLPFLKITEFPDDQPPFVFDDLEIGEMKMGINGDAIKYSVANPYTWTLNVIPESLADIGLELVFRANMVAKGKTTAKDDIKAVITLPDKRVILLDDGYMVGGTPAVDGQQEGRIRTRSYKFKFAVRSGG